MRGRCSVDRRALMRGAAGAAGAAVAGAIGALAPSRAQAGSEASSVPTVTPDDIVFEPRLLRRGRPAEVGLLPEKIERMRADLSAYLAPTPDHPGHPSYPGAVALAAKDGVIVLREAVGRRSATRTADRRVDSPPSSRSRRPPAPSTTSPRCPSCSPRSRSCDWSSSGASTWTRRWPAYLPSTRKAARPRSPCGTCSPTRRATRVPAALQRVPDPRDPADRRAHDPGDGRDGAR